MTPKVQNRKGVTLSILYTLFTTPYIHLWYIYLLVCFHLPGESFSHTPPEVEATVMIKQSSCSTINSYSSRSPSPQNYSQCAATLNLNDPSEPFIIILLINFKKPTQPFTQKTYTTFY